MKKIFVVVLVIAVLSSLGCGKDKKDDSSGSQATMQTAQSNPTQQDSSKVVDERAIIFEWYSKIDNIAGKYLADWKLLWDPSLQLLTKQVASQEELYQNHKTVYQNLNELSNKLINYEMMYREVRIPNEISADKKEQMLQIQNLYADGVKKMRESVDVMKMMAMRSNFPQSEKDKVTSMSSEASTMFTNANKKWEQFKQKLK